ncbi:hypothetical protein GCM10023079_46700 [Streptomyces chitinivorans]
MGTLRDVGLWADWFEDFFVSLAGCSAGWNSRTAGAYPKAPLGPVERARCADVPFARVAPTASTAGIAGCVRRWNAAARGM